MGRIQRAHGGHTSTAIQQGDSLSAVSAGQVQTMKTTSPSTLLAIIVSLALLVTAASATCVDCDTFIDCFLNCRYNDEFRNGRRRLLDPLKFLESKFRAIFRF